MRVFLNELALADAWISTSSIHQPLAAILQARQQQPVLRDALYCARGFGGVQTPAGVPLSRAAQALPRDTRVQLFEWIAKFGPVYRRPSPSHRRGSVFLRRRRRHGSRPWRGSPPHPRRTPCGDPEPSRGRALTIHVKPAPRRPRTTRRANRRSRRHQLHQVGTACGSLAHTKTRTSQLAGIS